MENKSWKWNGFATVHEAVDAKTGGLADEMAGTSDGRTYNVQNLEVLADWLPYYVQAGMSFFIAGDYDADGEDATAELVLLLRELGAANVGYAIPRRPDGFGLSEAIVNRFMEMGGPGVLITVDNGIAALDAVKKAKELGFVVIVTDHHEPVRRNGRIILPDADLIVDPHIPSELIAKTENVVANDFEDYCGAGLIYKLAERLLPQGNLTLDKIAAMAAIATVADMVSLRGDNRNVYKAGIEAIRRKRVTRGLQVLIDSLNVNNVIDEGKIGFNIGPMLNAPGRVLPDGGEISVRTLLSENWDEARALVQELERLNDLRKKLKAEGVARALKIVEDECLYGCNPIVIYDPETPEGIVGLVAGELTERFYAASVVLTDSEKDSSLVKGSARAPEYESIIGGLEKVKDAHPEYLEKFGGHKGAAGVTVRKEFLSAFADEMQTAMGDPIQKPDVEQFDVETTPENMAATVEEVMKYAPYGVGNPPVVVKVSGFRLKPVGNVLYSGVMDDTGVKFNGGDGCTAIAFGQMEKYRRMRSPEVLDMIGVLSYNRFGGRTSPQMQVTDMKPSDVKPNPIGELQGSMSEVLRKKGLIMF